jgi:arylsulfatase A-like enzyme
MRGRSRSWRSFGAAVCCAGLLACAPPAPPNVVLISLDTTRADHLGVYGYAGGTSPNLDRFAERAVVYERAYATSSWTLPTHASIFTGLLPMQHGAQSVAKGANRSLGYSVRPLEEGFTTLAELFAAAGYRTGAVVGGPALRSELGVAQGFEVYDDELATLRAKVHGRPAAEVAAIAAELVHRFDEEPYFLFVNFFDPHAPYRPPAPHDRGLANPDEIDQGAALLGRLLAGEPAHHPGDLPAAEREWIERLLAGYDAEIRYMDAQLGTLLAVIAAAPRGDATLVVITADHGESFGEHHFISHGAHLYEDNVRVPLLVRYPGANAGERVASPVQNHRLFATVLDFAGIPVPEGVDARSLRDPSGEIVLQVQRSDLNIRMFGEYFDRDLLGVQAWPHKLVLRTTGERELFDLANDPGELSDLAGERPELVEELTAKLREAAARSPAQYSRDSRAELRPDTAEALRALGYIE